MMDQAWSDRVDRMAIDRLSKPMDGIMFEVIGPDGHRWALYADGRIYGFPDGSYLLNHALPALTVLRITPQDIADVQAP